MFKYLDKYGLERRPNISSRYDKMRPNISGRYDKMRPNISGSYDKMRPNISGRYDKMRPNISSRYEKDAQKALMPYANSDNLDDRVLPCNLIWTFHYENTPIQICLKFHHQKTKSFQIKNLIFFHISVQNIDSGYSLEPPRRGGSNEYPQSMFLSRNKKNNVYPCKSQSYYIKVGFMGVKII